MLDNGIGLGLKLVFAHSVSDIFLCVDYCPIISKNREGELISVALSNVKVMRNLRDVSCIVS